VYAFYPLQRLLAVLIGYAFGTFQTAYVVGKLSAGIDIREHGSKNAGMTNVTRVVGKKQGFIVFVIDIIKAVLAFAVATLIWDGGGTFFASSYVLPGLYAGLGAILGHNFPVFLKFRGGKGVSCTLGLILMLDWRVAVIAFAAGIVAVAVFRFISLASLLITFLAPVLMFIFGYDVEVVALTAVIGALAWFMHRENIQRLLSGTERKFLSSKS